MNGSRWNIGMRWWMSGFFTLLTILFTLVVWWARKSGGACYERHDSQSEESYLCSLITPANLPTDYLVIVGMGGVFVAIFTLQSMQVAAIAARDNIDLLIDKERARIYIEPDAFDFDFSDSFNPRYVLKYKVICAGTTPAMILESRVTAEINVTQERAEPERLGLMSLPNNFTPSTIETTASLIGVERHFSSVLDEQIQSRKVFVNFWGYARYRDILFKGGGFWIRRFWYIWDPEMEHFVRCGAPKDNAEQKRPAYKKPN